MEELDENDCRKVDKSLATDEEINQFERDLMTNQALKETEAKLAKAVEALEEIPLLALVLKPGGLATDNDRDTWCDDIINIAKQTLEEIK